jgi:23S rRNA (uridine2552-2'-O)-methyltransferase
MKVSTQSKKVNKAWLNDHIHDPWVKLAQKEGYRARAAYKLKEIDEAFHLVKPGQLVLDLGSTPGAWSQYLRRRMGPLNDALEAGQGAVGSRVIALDLLPMEAVDGVLFLQGDFREEELLQRLLAAMQGRSADLIVSDMAPNLSGIAGTDAARVEHLIELALDLAQLHLNPHGALVAKVFHSAGYDGLVRRFKAQFKSVKVHKPKASRDRSAETFLIGWQPTARA